MTKPIPDKAEVALEYPDKLYIGTFERTSRFDAHLDETGFRSACTALAPPTCARAFARISTMGCLRTSCAIWQKRCLPCRRPMRRTAMRCEMERRHSIKPWILVAATKTTSRK